MDDLKQCLDILAGKNAEHTKRWNYYDGKQPLAFKNKKWDEALNGCVPFVKNWCQVIINVTRDRLSIQSWNIKDGESDTADAAWKKHLKKCARQVHLSVLACGEAYVVATPDEGCYYHDPRQCCVLYDSEHPDIPRVGCKVWTEGETHRANLYYADRIEKYSKPASATEYTYLTDESGTNKSGVIPLFRFCADPRTLTGELTDGVLSAQDALNKLLNDMMVSSEFCGFPQRYAIADFEPGSKLPIGPGSILTITPSDSSAQPSEVGAFPAMTPDVYIKSMDDLTLTIAAMTSTPKHFFHAQGGDPSGEALAAMESPLIAKVELFAEVLGETWRQVMAHMIGANPDSVEEIWKPAHTVQPKTQAETRKTNAEAGIPVINQLRDEGWTDDQLDELKEDMNATTTATAATVPSVAGLSRKATPEQTLAAKTAGKDALTAKTAPKLESALKVDVPDGAVERMMTAASGKK